MNLSADNLSADESTRILVVEDEPQLAAVLCDYLKASGYETCHLADGEAVLDTFTRWQPGLVLLDLMLPGADGVSLCRELREHSDVRPQACRRPACPGLHRLVPACRGACRERACTWTYPAVAPRCMGAGWT